MSFAENTSVPVERSKAELKRLLDQVRRGGHAIRAACAADPGDVATRGRAAACS
jgi:hypothetical protein